MRLTRARWRVTSWFRRQADEKRLGWWTAVFGLLAAVLTVAGVLLGFFLSDARDDVAALKADKSKLIAQVSGLKEQAARDSGTIDALRRQTESLDKRISDQAAQLQALQQQVPPVVKEADVPSVRTNNRITLAQGGDIIDLNSTTANWAAGTTNFGNDTVRLGSDQLQFGFGMSAVQLSAGAKASYKTCAVASGYARLDYMSGFRVDLSMLEGDRMCFRLDSGRYAAIRATAVRKASVDLAITVWELP